MSWMAKLGGWADCSTGTSHYFRPGEFKSTCGRAFRCDDTKVYKSTVLPCLNCAKLQNLPPKLPQPKQAEMFPGVNLATGKLEYELPYLLKADPTQSR